MLPCGTALSQHEKFLVLALVIDRPGIYLHEICRELLRTTGTDTSVATIFRLLQKCGFTRAEIKAVSWQQSETLRQKYRTEMELYEAGMLIFVVSAICAISLKGVLECQFESGSVNGEAFYSGSVNGEAFYNFI